MATLKRFISAGGLFTVATGRSAPVTAHILCQVKLPLPAIVNNGAMTADLNTGAICDLAALPGAALRDIFRGALAMGLTPLAYVVAAPQQTIDDVVLVHGALKDDHSRRYLKGVSPSVRTVEDDQDLLAGALGLSMLLLDDPTKLERFFGRDCHGRPEVSTHLGCSAYRPGLGVGEVQAIKATKSRAALSLARQQGLDAGQIVAFGDNANDLDLLRLAGEACCPPGAAPQVLAEIQGRLAPPAEEGVARYLEDLMRFLA